MGEWSTGESTGESAVKREQNGRENGKWCALKRSEPGCTPRRRQRVHRRHSVQGFSWRRHRRSLKAEQN